MKLKLLGRLLHVANSAPEWIGKERFYAMKKRILERYGYRDGHDTQHIEGKVCFSCNGTGTWHSYYHEYSEPCFKCGGDGWFKNPVWVTLARHRLGAYSFHTPENRSYEKPEPDVTRITGYISHPNYSFRYVNWCGLWLYVMFGEWRGAWDCTKAELHSVTWPIRRPLWRIKSWLRSAKRKRAARLDSDDFDCPF